MDSGFEYINDLTVQGTVVGTKIGENYLTMTIATTQTRVYRNGKNEFVTNFPRVIFYSENANKARKFKKGSVVTVNGNIHNGKTKEGRYFTAYTGTDIEEAPKLNADEDYNISLNTYEPPINEVRITGRVSDVRMSFGNHIQLRVITETNGKKRYIDVDYRANPAKFLGEIRPGSFAYILGEARTDTPDKDRPNKRTSWIEAKEIIKLDYDKEGDRKNAQRDEFGGSDRNNDESAERNIGIAER